MSMLMLIDAYRVQPLPPTVNMGSPLSLSLRFLTVFVHTILGSPQSHTLKQKICFLNSSQVLCPNVTQKHWRKAQLLVLGAVSLCHLDEPSLTSCTCSRPCLQAATLLSINFRNCTAPQPRTPAQTAQRCHQQRTRRELQGGKGSARCARARTRVRAHTQHNTCIFLRMADIARRLRSDCEVESKGVAPALAEVQLCWQCRVAFVGEAEGTGATSSGV